MLDANIKPYANCIYDWGRRQSSLNLINVDYRTVMMTLLPRTTGTLSRRGLKVNGMRYHAEGYTERYLGGGSVTVAFNPDDVTTVWLLEEGVYTEFALIESRYKSLSLETVQSMQEKKRRIVKAEERDNLQAKVDLADHIQVISGGKCQSRDVSVKSVRNNRRKERMRNHEDFLREERDD